MGSLTERSWTLFLDRDGVINRRIEGDCVRTWGQFEFLPGAREALAALSKAFTTIVVVTNQPGVGQGLLGEADLATIHRHMVRAVQIAGGRIDAVYHCPHDPGDSCGCRIPAPGLLERAARERPAIDLASAVVVGDSDSDMALARRVGVSGVLVAENGDRPVLPAWDAVFDSLLAYSAVVERAFTVATRPLEDVRGRG
jgi:D-glycero-D-manno-heptose 1,7-bisphosphate phosphatase